MRDDKTRLGNLVSRRFERSLFEYVINDNRTVVYYVLDDLGNQSTVSEKVLIPDNLDYWELMIEVADQLYTLVGAE